MTDVSCPAPAVDQVELDSILGELDDAVQLADGFMATADCAAGAVGHAIPGCLPEREVLFFALDRGKLATTRLVEVFDQLQQHLQAGGYRRPSSLHRKQEEPAG